MLCAQTEFKLLIGRCHCPARRSPLLDGHCTHAELLDLYRLYIKNSDAIPPPFSSLLQMQEMLGLESSEAAEVEAEVVQAGVAFEI